MHATPQRPSPNGATKSAARGAESGQSAKASRVVVVANRLPVRRVGDDWQTSPGGLVGALTPLVQATGGSWVGWDGSATPEGDDPTPPFDHDGIRVQPVPLSADEIETFYHGFCNETVWPLYHDALRSPQFHRRWWRPYRRVNKRFADATAEVASDGDIIWVHDYQLQLAPMMLREMLPHAKIGWFNHIPFPPLELFAKMPWRTQVLEGLLGADLVGFQTKLSAANFARAAKRYAGARGTDSRLEFQGRMVRVIDAPISIDVDQFADAAGTPETKRRAAEFRASFDDRRIVLGVDRLDYTKGIDIRLRAFEEVLSRGSVSAKDTVFVQIAVPTREAVDDYADLRSRVNELVGRINGTYAELGNIAVHYIYRGLPFEELLACYRAADVMMVTPFRDGMNLVAKEYVATRLDNSGVLVLSEFAGAALELRQALLVNPHDIDGMADAMELALSIDPADARRRMAALRRAVRKNDVYKWSESFLDELRDG